MSPFITKESCAPCLVPIYKDLLQRMALLVLLTWLFLPQTGQRIVSAFFHQGVFDVLIHSQVVSSLLQNLPIFHKASSELTPEAATRRRVTFGELEIYEFPQTLGDNPCVNSGVPVALGWWPIRKQVIDVDYYESNRYPRRRRKDLIVPPAERQTILLFNGYNPSDMYETMQMVQKIKRQRLATIHAIRIDLYMAKVNVAVQRYQ